MANKKVLLIRNVLPSEFGGAEIYQLKLAEMLKKNGFSPVIVTSSCGLFDAAKKEGYLAVKAPFFKRQNWSGIYNVLFPVYVVKQVFLKKWYKKLFWEQKPVAINVQSRDDLIAATRAARKNKIRVIWTDHADFRSWVLINTKTRFKNMIGKWILRCAKDVYKIVLISEAEKKWFEENVGKMDNVQVINNGVKDERAIYAGEKPVKKSFCFVGRIVEEKGVRELIFAFNKLKEKYPDMTLTICGGVKGGEGESELRKMCGDVSFAGIELPGRVASTLPFLAKSEMFVLPSYQEGMSLALLEAMMMGKAIISTDVGGAKEMVEDKESGLLIKVRDEKSLEKAMEYMLMEPAEAKKMGKNARKVFEEKYDFEDIFAKKMLSLYNIEKEML